MRTRTGAKFTLSAACPELVERVEGLMMANYSRERTQSAAKASRSNGAAETNSNSRRWTQMNADARNRRGKACLARRVGAHGVRHLPKEGNG